jgi:hypothetical protein
MVAPAGPAGSSVFNPSMEVNQRGSFTQGAQATGVLGRKLANDQHLAAMAELRGYGDKVYGQGRAPYLPVKYPACQDAIGNVARGAASAKSRPWMCQLDQQIRFREGNYTTYSAQCRLFIEGAEVTPWLEGSVQWTIQGTGGRNSCNFTLNNHNEAFTITPANVCSNVDPTGWRIFRDRQGRVLAENAPITWNSDESAKYLIYKRKYEKVDPRGKKPNIDADGMWLYRLEPEKPVFDKHDCVRLFVQLAHVSGVGTKSFVDAAGRRGDYTDLWVPAFTGFIDSFDTVDDRVAGRRTIPVRCYCFRGILGRMRVRTDANPSPGSKGTEADTTESKVKAVMPTGIDCGGPGAFYSYDAYRALLKQYQADTLVTQYVEVQYNLFLLLADKQGAAALTRAQASGRLSVAEPGVMRNTANLTKQLVCAVHSMKRAQDRALALGVSPETVKIISRQDNNWFELAIKTEPVLTASNTLKELIDALNGGMLLQFVTAAVAAKADWWGLLVEITTNVKAVQPGSTPYLSTAAGQQKWAAFLTALDTSLKKLSSDYPKVTLGRLLVDTLKTGASYPDPYLFYDNRYLPLVVSVVSQFIKDYKVKLGPAVAENVDKYFRDEFSNVGGMSGLSLWNLPAEVLTKQVNVGVQSFFLTCAVALGKYRPNMVQGAVDVIARVQDAIKKANVQVTLVNQWIAKYTAVLEQALKTDTRVAGRVEQLRKMAVTARAPGAALTAAQRGGATNAEYIAKDASYDEQNAGMFADISRASGQDAHPLAGLSFEQAVDWLCITNSKVWRGFRRSVQDYGGASNDLQEWNKTALFGIFGRPLTYQEVTVIGRGTVMELENEKGAFSPIQPYLHVLLPKQGTGVMSIVQQHVSNSGAASTQFRYETREQLLNEICDVLDYSFYCSPMGDLVFEFPHYNAIPSDFGKIFEGAYTMAREVKSSKIAHENGQIYTAWILQGLNQQVRDPSGGQAADFMTKEVIVSPSLARRCGANPRYIKLKIPGVGGTVNTVPGSGTALQQLMAYAFLAVQRDVGKYEAVTIEHPYRPYLLPNRPVWLTHRQRIGLVSSVQYSVEVHRGAATASTDLGYIRSLFRDGTYRSMAGGYRSPVDYSGIMSGYVPGNLRLGVGANKTRTAGAAFKSFADTSLTGAYAESEALKKSAFSTGAATDARGTDGFACGPALKNAWIIAGSNYENEAASTFTAASHMKPGRSEMYASNSGDKNQAVVMQGSGYTSTSSQREKTAPAAAPPDTTQFKFLNPHVAGVGVFNIGQSTNYGYSRAGLLGKAQTAWLIHHPGIDIDTPNPGSTYVLAPIPLTELKVLLNPYYSCKTVSCKALTSLEFAEYTANLSTRPFTRQWDGYKPPWWFDYESFDIASKHMFLLPLGPWASEGLSIMGYGRITLPGDSGSGTVRCRLKYMHLSSMVTPSNASSWYGYGKKTTCAAGDKLARPGNTGSSVSPHLHLNVAVHMTANPTANDTALFEASRKATLQYLRDTLYVQMYYGEDGKVGNGQLSAKWRARLVAEGMPADSQDPAVALEFAERMNAEQLRQYLVNKEDLQGEDAWISVNPYLFFKPEQLVTPLGWQYRKLDQERQGPDIGKICGTASLSLAQEQERQRKCDATVAKTPAKDKLYEANKCAAIKARNEKIMALSFRDVGDGSSQSMRLALAAAEANHQGSAAAVTPQTRGAP